MLQKLRDRTQSTGFKIIVAVLVFALAFFGFGAFNVFAPGDPEVASVNGDEITRTMVEVETERQRRRILLQLGDEVDPEAIDQLALQQASLEQLIVRKLLDQAIAELGLQASKSQVDDIVAGDPNFQVDGQFNENLYRRAVSALGYSAPEYLEEMANLLRLNQLRQAVTETAVLPLWETRLLNALMNQSRDIAYLPFTVEHFSAGIEIAPEQILTYYDEHQAEFMTEESVDVAYLELNWQMLEQDPAVDIGEEQIRGEYEADKANAGGEELRNSSHILLQVTDDRSDEQARVQLGAIRERIDAGESFADLAREYSEDPGSSTAGGELGSVGKGIFDPEFERVLWSLEEDGQISEPVKTQFGYHLIRLDGIEIQPYPTFEERRADIERRLVENAARELFNDRVRELDSLAFEMNDSLNGIADTLQLDIGTAAGITRESGEGIFVNEELRDALFEVDVLLDGNNSPTVEYGDGRAVVARVSEHYPPEVRPFAEVEEEINALLVEQKARQALLAARSETLQQIREGASVTNAANAHGLDWETFELVSRADGSAPEEVLSVAFALPRPPEGDRSVGEASLGEEGEALVTVTRVVDGDLAAVSEAELDTMRGWFASRGGTLDFAALQAALDTQADIERR